MERIRKLLRKNSLYFILLVLVSLYVFYSVVKPKTSTLDFLDDTFYGTLKNVKISDSKIQIKVDLGRENLICNYYFPEDEGVDYSDFSLGSKVKIEGTLKEVLNNSIPNTFNYKEYLYRKNTFYTCVARKIEVVKAPNIFYRVKNAIVGRIMTYEVKDYLYTLLIGDRSLLDEEMYSFYRENGVSHLLAISGMHIGLFSMILLGIFKKIKKNGNGAYFGVMILIWFYAFLVGFTPSVVRASLLFTVGTFNKLFKLGLSPFKVFIIVLSIVLIMNPNFIFDVGFLYSFTIAGGLILSSKFLVRHKILGVSLIATLYSIPITALNFYKINLLGIVNNLLFVPLISSVVYPLCLLTFLFRFLEPILEIVIKFTEILNSMAVKIDFLSFVIPKMPVLSVIFYYVILVFYFNRKPKRSILYLFICVLFIKIMPFLSESYKIAFLDVGQGDSILIVSPHFKDVILVDTGGVLGSSYNPSNNVITYMHSLGIDKIDHLILTHGDFDHMGDAINIVENFKVGEVVLNCEEKNDLEKELIKVIEKKKIKYYSCIKELSISNDKLYFLNTKEYDNENDNSSVIYAKFNNYQFLFMGDASTTAEKEILVKYKLSNIDVLKVGHHGSKTSSGEDFINTVTPKYSIISVGKNNRYGHPNKEVLNNLNNSKIYRTDIDGSIIFKIKKNKLDIETCPP